MRPKKAKEFIPITSKKVNLEQPLVEDVLFFYWREIRKNLSSLSHMRIHLSNLGDFTIKHWKVDDKLESLTKWKIENEQNGKTGLNEKYKIGTVLSELSGIKQIIGEENQRKDFIKFHKNESKRKHNKDLEKQGTDSGGDN